VWLVIGAKEIVSLVLSFEICDDMEAMFGGDIYLIIDEPTTAMFE
jgi:hypothetical protein